MDNKLFLLDAYALIYRAYYALIRSPRYTTTGFNTSAIFGFCNTLEEVLKKERPTHIAVCFDPHGPTFRHEAFKEYKANRQQQPEDITLSIPIIKEILEARGILAIEIDGYEADDVIGTLSRKAEKAGFITYMMTPDKDFGQLVTEKVLMYKPSLRGQDFELRGVQEIKAKYGIDSPLQVIDMLALEGDSIDNIPGCPGIGPKTAQKLIQEYGSVESLIDSVDTLKGSIKDKIVNNAEQIIFSKFLATIKTDVPLSIEIDSLKRGVEDIKKLKEIYTRLEFRTFINRIGDDKDNLYPSHAVDVQHDNLPVQGNLFDFEENESKTNNIDSRPIKIHTGSLSELGNILKRIDGIKTIGLAIKSVGENAMNATPISFALAFNEKDTYYYTFPSEIEYDENEYLKKFFVELFNKIDLNIVVSDVKRIFVLLHSYLLDIKCKIFDITLANYLIDSEARHLLPEIAHNYLNYNTVDYALDLRSRKTYENVESSFLKKQLCESAAISISLLDKLEADLDKFGLYDVYNKIELPLAFVLGKMEINGVRIDVNELAILSREYSKRLEQLENEVFTIAGIHFNVGSPSQVGEILFERLKIDSKAKKTKKGSYSTTEDTLEKYKYKYPIVEKILKIRQLKKLLATYIDTLPKMVDSRTGKIHTTFNQTVTSTGRLSSTNPNLQNIPVRGDDGREIRKAFIADEGCIFMSADYSQIELRLMADFSKDPAMLESFTKGRDIHADTASRIYKKKLEDVTDDERRNAKTANFGIIYGISAFGLSERLGIPRSEAKQLIEDYMATYPSIKDYISETISKARDNGFVATYTGRRRYLPEITSNNAVVRGYGERNAVNAPLQGSAADIIKAAMVAIQNRIESEGLKSQMIMQVHDELIFNVIPEELVVMQALVKEEMEKSYSGIVRMETSIGTGRNWLEAH